MNIVYCGINTNQCEFNNTVLAVYEQNMQLKVERSTVSLLCAIACMHVQQRGGVGSDSVVNVVNIVPRACMVVHGMAGQAEAQLASYKLAIASSVKRSQRFNLL